MDLRREAVWEEAFSTNWTELSARTPSTKPPFGVNVLGPIDGKSGGAESSRLLYAGLAAHVPTAAVNVLEYPRYEYSPHASAEFGLSAVEEGSTITVKWRGKPVFIPTSRDAGYAFNVVVVNADQTKVVRRSYPWRRWRERYNVGYWAWETDALPERWAREAETYDEIWASSNYSAAAVATTLANDPVRKRIPVLAMAVGERISTKARGAVHAARLRSIRPREPVPDSSPVCYWLKHRDSATLATVDDAIAHARRPENRDRDRTCRYVSTTAFKAAQDLLARR